VETRLRKSVGTKTKTKKWGGGGGVFYGPSAQGTGPSPTGPNTSSPEQGVIGNKLRGGAKKKKGQKRKKKTRCLVVGIREFFVGGGNQKSISTVTELGRSSIWAPVLGSFQGQQGGLQGTLPLGRGAGIVSQGMFKKLSCGRTLNFPSRYRGKRGPGSGEPGGFFWAVYVLRHENWKGHRGGIIRFFPKIVWGKGDPTPTDHRGKERACFYLSAGKKKKKKKTKMASILFVNGVFCFADHQKPLSRPHFPIPTPPSEARGPKTLLPRNFSGNFGAPRRRCVFFFFGCCHLDLRWNF